MYDFLEKEAKLCVKYSVNVQPGDKVLIWGTTVAEPLLKYLYKEVLKAGGIPLVKLELQEQESLLHAYGNHEQLSFNSPTNDVLIQQVDIGIKVFADTPFDNLENIDKSKIEWGQTGKRLFYSQFFQRLAKKDLRWCLLPYPTEYLASQANMNLEQYADLIRQTLFLESGDPIQKWHEFSQYQQKYCDFLNSKKQFRIISDKTDLTFSTENRIWLNSNGHNNLPDGEIYTGPVEDSVNGTIFFDMPSTSGTITPIPKGIEGISLTFKDGIVVQANAEKGQSILTDLLSTDEGAKQVGEIAIGMNPRVKNITRKVAFDEKIKGTIHLALGNGYPETGNHNQSKIHWDIICDMRSYGEIYADDELIYQNGDFLF